MAPLVADIPAVFKDHLDTWIHSNDFSANTIKLYTDAATRWLAQVKPWEERWPVRSIEWRHSLEELALKTQAVFVGAAKGFVDYLLDLGAITGRNPFNSVRFRGLATSYMHRRSLTDEEVQKLFASCDLKTDLGLRDHTILMIMLHTALRIGGVSRINVEDIELRGDMWVVKYQGKGGRDKSRVKVLAPNVITAVKAYLKKTGRTLQGKGPLFIHEDNQKLTIHGMRKSITRRFNRCGIDDSAVTAHSLRHTAATKAVDSGNDLKAVQDLLDHQNLATTDRYVHSVRQLEQAAELTINYEPEKETGKANAKRGRQEKDV
jgi:integrase/recombinase XerC